MASKSDFFALATLKKGTVDVGGLTFNVREMTVAERSKLVEMMKDEAALAPVFLVRSCVVNDDGTPMFTEADAEKIAASTPSVVDAVANAVLSLSAFGGDDPKG